MPEEPAIDFAALLRTLHGAAVQTYRSLLDFHPHIHMLLTDSDLDAAGRFVRAEPPPGEVRRPVSE